MALSFDQIALVLKRQLTAGELDHGVAYAGDTVVPAGVRLDYPRISIDVPWQAYLGFVDREPIANWGHACRYVLISRDTGEFRSFDSRFPPFPDRKGLHWKVVYKAKGVPDSAIAVKT